MFLIVSRYLIPKGYRGITLFPFVILRNPPDRANKVLVNHEKIHIRQQLEFLIIPFFLWYFIEYGIRLIQYKNKNMAYRNISFEREAYSNEFNLNYIKGRKLWGFRKYL
ncbi:hypothetical protein [Flavobacterium microcysteis]|uniref:DUF4157 domain-containing protein n=1 Tax=Flavobacterium microcysteis TaxID=2596891 RepID=A0A501Q0C1_9FLAO|nr:hypothetical protein [Flavobacterium microcysteis]TPD65752.1 hypothetical protein FJA49_16325 [Flavobacterium microcysteis]